MSKKMMLVSAVLFTAVSLSAAMHTNEVDGIKWVYSVSDGKATLGGGSLSLPAIAGNPQGKIEIPTAFGETQVVAIASYAFSNKAGITEVSVPTSVLSIGYNAFGGCPNIRSMTLPFVGACRGDANGQGDNFGYVFGSSSGSAGCASVRQSYNYNHDNNSSSSIYYIPNGLASVTITDETLLRPYAFQNCSMLTNITVNSGVTSIWSYAFEGCSRLLTFDVPASVTGIGSYAFRNCPELSSLHIRSDYVNIDKDAFYGCPASLFDATSIPGAKLVDGYVVGFEASLSGIVDISETRGVMANAFSGNTKITKVILPSGMTLIPANVFYGCTSLASVTIPDTVETIGSSAFSGCSALNSVTIPDGVAYIGDYAFYGCRKLLTVGIPENVARVGSRAFAYCTALKDITIPATLSYIGAGAFANDSALATVNISDLAAWCRITFADFDSNPTRYSHSLTLDGEVLRDVVIPDEIQKLNPKVFTDNFALTSVIVPEGVPDIPVDAFIGCRGITNMVLPESIADIGEAAFQDCTNLTTVAIPIAVTNISKHAFYGYGAPMGLEELTLPENVVSVGEGAFQNCTNIATVTFPESLVAIGPYAFAGCQRLVNPEFPSSLRTIGNYAFQNCTGFTEIEIPGSVTSIGPYGFYNCANLTNVIVHSGLTSIGNSAFAGSGGLTVTLAEDITSVYASLFASCGGITNVVFTEAVTNIDNYAFQNCTLLAGLSLPLSLKSIGQYSFYGCNRLAEVVIPEGVTSIGQYAFGNCTKLARAVVPSTVKTLGQYAFSGCSRLLNIDLADGATAVGNYSFQNCTSLTNAVIPSTVKTVGAYAFAGCTGLKTVTFPDGMTSIGSYAFRNCRSLSDLEIPSSVKTIGEYSFEGCNGLQNVDIPKGVATIGGHAFYACTNLMSLSVPASATNIGWYAFAACSNLTQVTLLTTPSRVIPTADLSMKSSDWSLVDGDIIRADSKKFDNQMAQEATGQGVLSFEWRTPGYWYHNSYYNKDYFSSYGYFSLSVDYSEYSYGSYYSDSCNSETWVPVSIPMSSGGRHTVDWFFGWDRYAVSNGDVDPSEDFGSIRSLSFVPSRGGNGNGVDGTVVGASAFEGCVNLSRVNIADVGAWCGTVFENAWANPFRYAKHLYVGGDEIKNLVIPDSVNAVSGWAFANCGGITNIVFPEGLTSIGTHAFQNTAIDDISLPSSVTNVGTFAFAGCDGVKSVSIPAGLRKINDFAFSGQSKVVSATLPSSTALSKFLPDSLDTLREITIADGETGVVDEAFAGCSALETVTIPDTVKTIGRSAFRDCTQLTTVQIPSSVNTVEYDAFDGCGRLREISVGSGNVSCSSEDGVLFDERSTGRKLARCPEALSARDYSIPDGVTCVGEYSFRNCADIEKVTIPASMTNIGARAFMNCGSLAAFEVAEENPTYKSIDGVLFSKDGKTLLRFPPAKAGHYDIPDGVETIATYAFEGCRRLSSLSFGADVKSIEACAFDGCTVLALTVLNDGLKRIGDYAFKNCTSLAALTIPESVTSLGDGAFDGCDQLESLSVPENIATKPKNVGGIIRGNVSLYRGCIYNVTNDLVVMGGATLRIPSGVVLKMNSWRSIAVLKGGRLVTTGTRAAPVVITSSKDDEFGGDANGDGNASTPQSGDWGGLRIQGEAELAYTRIRYGQSSYGPGVVSLSNYQYYDDYYYYGEDAEWTDFANYYDDEARLTMDGCIVEHSTDDWSVGICNEGGNVVARNCVFFDLPSCVYGNGRYVNNSYDSYTMAGQTNHFVNCVFHGCNSVVMDDWYNVDSTAAVFDNCVFSEMVEWVGGYGESIPSDLVFRNCCFWNPDDGFYDVQQSAVVGKDGNMWGDPLLEDADSGDYRIKSDSPCIDAGDTAIAPLRDYYGQLRNGAADIGVFEVQLRPVAADVDLAALAVACDSQAIVGQPITATWTVGNVGTEDVVGEWRDIVELVDSRGSVVALGEHAMSGGVAAGGNKTATATFTVPAVAPGLARMRVRVNYLRDIYEGSLTANNSMVSDAVAVEVAKLDVPAGGVVPFAIAPGSSVGYWLGDNMAAGGLLIVHVASATGGGVEAWTGKGTIPTADIFYASAVEIGGGDYLVRVPAGGDAYASFANGGSGLANVEVGVETGAFLLLDTGVVTAPNDGMVNLTLYGNGFADGMEAWIERGGERFSASEIAVFDSVKAVVVFDVSGLAAGAYDVHVKKGGEEDAASLLALTRQKVGPKWSCKLDIASAVRASREYVGYFEYSNAGDMPCDIPYVKIKAGSDSFIRFGAADAWSDTIELMATSATYPASKLKPGETRRIPFRYKTAGRVFSVSCDCTYDDPSAFPWDTNGAYMRPTWASDELWGLSLAVLKSNVGATWNDYLTRMRANCDHLAKIGQPTYRLDRIWQLEINEALGVDFAVSTLASNTDLARPGRGFGLALSRSYGSGLYRRLRKGVFGYGWSDNYSAYAELQNSGATLALHSGSGSTYLFEKVNGKWTPEDARDKTTCTETSTEYVLTYRSGTVQRIAKNNMRVSSVRDNQGNSLSFTYNADKQLVKVEHCDGQSLSFTYAGGLLVAATDDQGRTTRYDYSGDLLVKVTAFNGLSTQYRYLPADGSVTSRALRQIAYADGTTRDYTYDGAGRVATVAINGNRQTVEIVRKALGSYIVVAPNGGETQVTLGASGEVIETVNSLGQKSTRTYTAETLLESVVGPTGKRARIVYNVDGQAVKATDAAGAETLFGYTSDFGNLAKVTDARGNSFDYGYDKLGRSKSISYADGSVESIAYNDRGDVTNSVNRRGQSITFTYDNEGNTLSKVWENGRTFTWAYDAKGNCTNATDSATGTVTMEYDENERLVRIVHPKGRGFAYEYDSLGRTTSRTTLVGTGSVPSSADIQRYTYDSLGRLSRMTDGDGNLYVENAYDETTGWLITQTYGNGTVVSNAYDILGRTVGIYHLGGPSSVSATAGTEAGPPVLAFFEYAYDAEGRRISQTTAEGIERYTYDTVGQLTDVIYPDGSEEHFTYDAVGNRITANGETYIANNLNQYTSILRDSATPREEILAYDLDGNMTRKGDTRYYYDIQNRLVAVTNETKDIRWACEYDVFGNRTKVIDHGTVKETLFVQGSLASAVADYDASGSPTTRHILLGSVRLADISNLQPSNLQPSTTYYHADGLASTRLLTDANGDTIATASYRAFGEVRTWGGPSSVSATAGTEAGPPSAGWVGTLGVERDDATGLVFMRNRYYDAEQGRFIQMDPIGINGKSINIYRYCENNSISRIDTSGYAWTQCDSARVARGFAKAASYIGTASAAAGYLGALETSGLSVGGGLAIGAACGALSWRLNAYAKEKCNEEYGTADKILDAAGVVPGVGDGINAVNATKDVVNVAKDHAQEEAENEYYKNLNNQFVDPNFAKDPWGSIPWQ